MSRIGRQPIPVPDKVQVTIDKANSKVKVKGPLGELERVLPGTVTVEQKDKELQLTAKTEGIKGGSALYGMARARLANMVDGVVTGFSKNLDIVGLGFKAVPAGEKITFTIGYSHPVDFIVPKGIKVEVDKKQTKLTVSGIDKDLVGQTAARIRGLRVPEPYKGTGIRYENERIHRKAGKTAAGAGGGGAAGGGKK